MGSSFQHEYGAIELWTWTAFKFFPSLCHFLPTCMHASVCISLTPCACHMPVPAYISVNVTDHVEREQDLVIWRKIGVSRPLMARRCQQFGAHVKILKSSTLGCYLTFLFENDVSRREPFTDSNQPTARPNQCFLALRLVTTRL